MNVNIKSERRARRNLRPMFYIGVFALVVQGAAAEEGFYPNSQEMALLPPYCKEKIEKKDLALNRQWESRLGSEYWLHLHHYCAGLNFLNRANRTFGDEPTRRHHLKNAESNMQYMLDRSEGFFLKPEIMTQIGRVQQELGNSSQAARSFQGAIALKADYAPAYAALADLYKKMGDRAKAVEVLTQGIEQSPGTRSLLRRLKELQ